MIATAFVTVTVPAVLPPRALRLAAVTAAASASLTVTVMTSAAPVESEPRLVREFAASVAVTTPVVAPAMSFKSEIDGLSLRVTVGSDTSTLVPSVTKAATA